MLGSEKKVQKEGNEKEKEKKKKKARDVCNKFYYPSRPHPLPTPFFLLVGTIPCN
jgi:hypothetical protein